MRKTLKTIGHRVNLFAAAIGLAEWIPEPIEDHWSSYFAAGVWRATPSTGRG